MQGQLTQWIRDVEQGDAEASRELFEFLYDEAWQIAQRCLDDKPLALLSASRLASGAMHSLVSLIRANAVPQPSSESIGLFLQAIVVARAARRVSADARCTSPESPTGENVSRPLARLPIKLGEVSRSDLRESLQPTMNIVVNETDPVKRLCWALTFLALPLDAIFESLRTQYPDIAPSRRVIEMWQNQLVNLHGASDVSTG